MSRAVFESLRHQARGHQDLRRGAIDKRTHQVAVLRIGRLAQILTNTVVADLGFVEVMIGREQTLKAVEHDQIRALLQRGYQALHGLGVFDVAILLHVLIVDVGERVAHEASQGTAALVEAPPDAASEAGDLRFGTRLQPFPDERAFADAADGFVDHGGFAGLRPLVEFVELLPAPDEGVRQQIGRVRIESRWLGDGADFLGGGLREQLGEGVDNLRLELSCGQVGERQDRDAALACTLEFMAANRVGVTEGDVDVRVVDQVEGVGDGFGIGEVGLVARVRQATDAKGRLAHAVAMVGELEGATAYEDAEQLLIMARIRSLTVAALLDGGHEHYFFFWALWRNGLVAFEN